MTLRALLFPLLALAASARAAGDGDLVPMRYRELPPGKYAVGVSGLLCTVCARALAFELAKVPQIESATADFHKEEAVIVVKLDATLTVNDVYRAMRRAERLSNLGGRFELRDVKYIP